MTGTRPQGAGPDRRAANLSGPAKLPQPQNGRVAGCLQETAAGWTTTSRAAVYEALDADSLIDADNIEVDVVRGEVSHHAPRERTP